MIESRKEAEEAISAIIDYINKETDKEVRANFARELSRELLDSTNDLEDLGGCPLCQG